MTQATAPSPILTSEQAATLLSNRGEKRLPNLSYKLAETPTSGFGLDTVLDVESSYDESKMSAWLNYADGVRRDGVGDLLEVSGIVTDRHRANPVILMDHGKGTHKWANWPIALAEEPETHLYTNEIDPVARTARLNMYFYQGKGLPGTDRAEEKEFALFCEQLYDLRVKRFIRGGSLGYQVIKAVNLQPDYEMGTPAGLHLIKVKMLEASLVTMPCNQDTVEKALALPTICGKPLSPYLVKALTPFAPDKKAQLGYEPREAKSTPVPLRDVGHSDIPPAQWKPGAGAVKHQPSDDISPAKAEQILKDGEVRGHPLTEKQRGMFGAATSNKELRKKYRRKAYESNQARVGAVMREFKEGKLRTSDGDKVTSREQALAIALHGKALWFIRLQNGPNAPLWSGHDWTRGDSTSLGFLTRQEAENALAEIQRRDPKIRATVEETSEHKDMETKTKGWITIGAHDHHGGTPVFIDDASGKITKGPSATVGKTPEQLGHQSPTAQQAIPAAKPLKGTSPTGKTQPVDDPKKLDEGQRSSLVQRTLQAIKTSVGDLLTKEGLNEFVIQHLLPAMGGPGYRVGKFAADMVGRRSNQRSEDVEHTITIEKLRQKRAALRAEHGSKSLEHTKYVSRRGMKAMPDAALDTTIGGGMPPTEETGDGTEKYGAQVIRRVHQDHSILFGEYDEMLNLLEDEEIKKKLEKKLQAVETELTEWEEMFESKFEGHGYPALDGAMDKEMPAEPAAETPAEPPPPEAPVEEPPPEAPAAEATSQPEDRPTEDEVVEGMQKDIKGLRTQYRTKAHTCTCGTNKGMCPQCGKDSCAHMKTRGKAIDPLTGTDLGDEEDQKKPGRVTDDIPASAEATPGDEEQQPKPGQEGVDQSPAADTDIGNEENQPKPGEAFHKGMYAPHEKKKIGEASSFLKALSGEANFDDDHRMEAHYHYKTLKPLGEALDAVDVTEGNQDMKSFGPLEDADQVVDLTEAKNMAHKMHRRAVGEAAGFFKGLRREKAFGDEHRAKCLAYHKALDPIAKMDDAEDATDVQDPNGPAPSEEGGMAVEPGEMGQKGLPSEADLLRLKVAQDRVTKAMVETNRKLARLYAIA